MTGNAATSAQDHTRHELLLGFNPIALFIDCTKLTSLCSVCCLVSVSFQIYILYIFVFIYCTLYLDLIFTSIASHLFLFCLQCIMSGLGEVAFRYAVYCVYGHTDDKTLKSWMFGFFMFGRKKREKKPKTPFYPSPEEWSVVLFLNWISLHEEGMRCATNPRGSLSKNAFLFVGFRAWIHAVHSKTVKLCSLFVFCATRLNSVARRNSSSGRTSF